MRIRVSAKAARRVEFTILLLVAAAVSALAGQRYWQSEERARASEAFGFLASVRASQERFRMREGMYTGDLKELDVTLNRPKHFSVSQVQPGRTGDLGSSWTMTLTRHAGASWFGEYTVVFDQQGFDARTSTIERLPRINPAR